MKYRFGRNVDEKYNYLQNLIEGAKQIPYLQALIVLRDTYERMYGIFDHDSYGAMRPMALVAMHPAEDIHKHGRMANFMRRFADSGVADMLNCSFQEFINMPREFTQRAFDISRERRTNKNKSAADIEKRLRDELNARDKGL